jgi:hypothetical protein
LELLPEVNRSAVDRLERYKSELLVVEHSVKKHKMKVDKLGVTVKKTHVRHVQLKTCWLLISFLLPPRTNSMEP